ncbi:hypothetical protein PHYPSEUDO_015567 [Phytophthora pseudosyringae]|uniref:Uncharacterized protein n=1 Tax=Phytophthora pseudosyringae TaxID=221518 RepID=A0A8T1V410_9STRA|nr:hypothetical protein PHYPSEUDO_015567 [Phytophthora pseudosyringae]
MGFAKITIFLKDAANHDDYNRRILDYFKDRHKAINDNKFTVAIEVVDGTNLNDFVLAGMESVPALQMQTGEAYIYGVNSILAALAKLEVVGSIGSGVPKRAESKQEQFQDSFYEMALKEMESTDQEDDTIPSTVKAYRTDTPETPITEKMIEEKTKAYNRIYEERKQRNGQRPPRSSGPSPPPRTSNPRTTNPSATIDVDKLISTSNYDKDEAMLMRQMTSR